MTFFAKAVDRRSRSAMSTFLSEHFRYDTLNSWNMSTSYAHCVKLHKLGLTSEQYDEAFDITGAEDFWSQISDPIDNFTASMSGAYTIGSNGRSGGYLVLYESRYEFTEHKSRCRSCGQLNFKGVAAPLSVAEAAIGAKVVRNGGAWSEQTYLAESEIRAIDLPASEKLAILRRLKSELKDCTIDNRCGRCHAEGERGRINISPLRTLSVYSGRSIDQDEDFSEWSMDQLRQRVELVTAFDAACDEIRECFLDLMSSCVAVEQTVMVPRKVTVLESRASL